MTLQKLLVTSQHFPLDPIGKLLGVTLLREMQLGYSNLSKEEWEAVGTLIDDCNIAIKKLIRVIIWGGIGHITEAGSQLKNEIVY